LALFAVIVLGQVWFDGDPVEGMRLFGASFQVLNLFGLALSAWAALSRRLAPAIRRPWRFITLAWLLSIVSNVGFAVASTPGSGSAQAWVAIGGRLLMVPALLAGVLTFPMHRLTQSERYRLGLDVATVVGGGFMVLWYFIVGPAVAQGGMTRTTLGLAGFPLGDLLLVFGVFAVLLRGAVTSPRHPLSILLAGLSMYLAGDLYFSYAQIHHDSAIVSLPTRLCLLLGAFGMVVAAAQQLRRAAEPATGTRRQRRGVRVSQLPYLALGLGYLLLVVATARDGALYPWGGLVAGVIVMTGAVAIRQIIAMRENHELVLTDSLTGLANRVRLRARLQQLVGRREPAAVLVIDLDGFKQVNDTLGHEAGDKLLVAFAEVLQRNVRQSDTAGRLGGDEFAVVLHGVTDADQATAVAERILAGAATPVQIGDVSMPIRASIGIALARVDDNVHALVHRADTAMYAAKRARSHSWRLYSDDMEQRRSQDTTLASDLESAAELGQLRVLYQPIVGLSGGELTAVEALVRWQHPTRGLLTPNVFIPLAEETGAIHDIGMWVLEQTCQQVRQWQRLMPAGQRLYASVNLSPKQLHRPTLVTEVLAVLHRTELDPRDLVLELTEGALVTEESGIPQLHALREHGIRIAVDDFGTGYSSLRYLTRLPVDILKLDRCFVAELNGSPEGSAVAEAVIRLSQILHLDTVAEGIEDPAQAAELTLLGCRTGQGYLFARPMEPDALRALLLTPAPVRS
jgi:diguanylate cyclase (GGDEF)-like protein